MRADRGLLEENRRSKEQSTNEQIASQLMSGAHAFALFIVCKSFSNRENCTINRYLHHFTRESLRQTPTDTRLAKHARDAILTLCWRTPGRLPAQLFTHVLLSNGA